MSLSYGCNRALPEGVARAWGARWIAPDDQVWDRTSWAPADESPDARDNLAAWLNGEALMMARRQASALRLGVGSSGSSTDVVTLFEDETGVIKGSPQGSFGYVYVAAWLHEDVAA